MPPTEETLRPPIYQDECSFLKYVALLLNGLSASRKYGM